MLTAFFLRRFACASHAIDRPIALTIVYLLKSNFIRLFMRFQFDLFVYSCIRTHCIIRFYDININLKSNSCTFKINANFDTSQASLIQYCFYSNSCVAFDWTFNQNSCLQINNTVCLFTFSVDLNFCIFSLEKLDIYSFRVFTSMLFYIFCFSSTWNTNINKIPQEQKIDNFFFV